MGLLAALANSHGMFMSLTLSEMRRLAPALQKDELSMLFWDLSVFGPKLRSISAYRYASWNHRLTFRKILWLTEGTLII